MNGMFCGRRGHASLWRAHDTVRIPATAQPGSSIGQDEHAIRATVEKLIRTESSKVARGAVWSEGTPFSVCGIRIRFLDSDTAVATALGAVWSSGGAMRVAVRLRLVRQRAEWRITDFEQGPVRPFPGYCIDDICLDGANAQIGRTAKEWPTYIGAVRPELTDRGAKP